MEKIENPSLRDKLEYDLLKVKCLNKKMKNSKLGVGR